MERKQLLFAWMTGCLCMTAANISAQESPGQMKEIIEQSGIIHRPLPLDVSRSLEEAGLQKEVLASTPLCSMKTLEGWHHYGIGKISRSTERSITGDGSLRLTTPTDRPDWKNSDHAVYGYSQATFDVKGANWEKYNRIFFHIYPDCEGSRNVHLNLYIHNDGTLKIPDEYGREGAHEINLVNRQWNKCYLEITELPRDKVTRLTFGATAFGRDRTTGRTLEFYIDGIELQQVANPEVVSGWMPEEGRIVYSTSGYTGQGDKIAITTPQTGSSDKKFRLVDAGNGQPVYEGSIRNEQTAIGSFGILDFSGFRQAGNYRLQTDGFTTSAFRIGENIWENSVWKALNFIFCERCGYPVPGKHDHCHADIYATHNGRTVAYNGGWHDAGDMSQQTLQTGDVMFALFEMANKVKGKDVLLRQRLLEEAKWGLDFILKCRFGDGYRASSAGMAIWTDNMTGNEDDTPARVHNNPFDNFLLAGMEAYAAGSIDDDPALQESLVRTAKEDFEFALKAHQETGYGNFKIFWEHSYNTSESQYMATASWAASQLFRLTGENGYARLAADFARFVLSCQRNTPLKDKDRLCGFFYRDRSRKVITHFNHQSREQVYMQSLIALCETQPAHPSYGKWKNAIELYASYLKSITRYSQPYRMIPSGVYHVDEAKDSLSFYAQHLFPGKQAVSDYTRQLENGIRLDKEHYLRIFPVWFSFRGNTAIHLAMGKAAALCGNFLNDGELKEIAEEQLRWTVGKNPFGQSLMYGEGDRYAQQYAALPGEMTGELPVGIQTKYNEDKPYWPQCNNATYKEVWMTSAGKWLSLIAEL